MKERLTVGAAFVGWPKITKIVNSADEGITKLLILALFLTGGRTQETLSLKKSNFDFKASKHSIIVKGMQLDKKFKVIGREELDDLRKDGKPREKLITEKINTIRDSFPILYREPLANRFAEAIKNLNRQKLFPSFSRQLSYYYVTRAGKNAKIRVSDHWFRGQRASQLQEEYLFKKPECETFFGWAKPASDMFSHYGSTTWSYLEAMMARGIKERQELDDFLSKSL